MEVRGFLITILCCPYFKILLTITVFKISNETPEAMQNSDNGAGEK